MTISYSDGARDAGMWGLTIHVRTPKRWRRDSGLITNLRWSLYILHSTNMRALISYCEEIVLSLMGGFEWTYVCLQLVFGI